MSDVSRRAALLGATLGTAALMGAATKSALGATSEFEKSTDSHRDLGKFVKELKDEITDINQWGLSFKFAHQCIYRVSGGDSGLWQRCPIWVKNAPYDANCCSGASDVTLGGERWPQDYAPTNWARFERRGESDWTYYFAGQHHKDGGWRWNSGSRFKKDRYENGYLYTISFEDRYGDDYNDLIIQAAFVTRFRFDIEETGYNSERNAVRSESVEEVPLR